MNLDVGFAPSWSRHHGYDEGGVQNDRSVSPGCGMQLDEF